MPQLKCLGVVRFKPSNRMKVVDICCGYTCRFARAVQNRHGSLVGQRLGLETKLKPKLKFQTVVKENSFLATENIVQTSRNLG